jgi:hypothetical protein
MGNPLGFSFVLHSDMKRIIVLSLFVGFLSTGVVSAQEEGFGLGIILGEPTGISFKAWAGYRSAFIGAAAWSFGNEDSLHMHLDYVFHNFRLIKLERDFLPVYFGLGVRVKSEKDVRIGVRIPLGLNYMFENAPLDIFVELVPVFDLTPRTDLYFNGGVGIRYYF